MNTTNTLDRDTSASSWNSYWQGDNESSAYSSSGVNHQGINEYWTSLFSQLESQNSISNFLDIASGNGALPELAMQVFKQHNVEITATDISAAAIANISQRFPEINCVVADALTLPFPLQSFDLVTSQFGIEYAGLEAIGPALALVKPGGALAFMLHVSGGSIDQECQSNQNALEQLEESLFVPTARKMFDFGFKAMAGADRRAYDDAASDLATTLPAVEAIIQGFGGEIAGGLPRNLYKDVASITGKLTNYHPDDVLPWIDSMQIEIKAYRNRMQSMLEASLDEQQFSEICSEITDHGFELQDNAALLDQQTQLPLAWVIRARKSS
ncbi:MAG: SAM-dependent methyltransferase [Cryomorphaceae bacterium]|jgi:SAM-dependent methyltransferase